MKRCPGCATVKPRDAFGLSKREPDGLQTRCKECRRQHRVENRAAISAKRKAAYAANPDAQRARSRAWYEQNRERGRESRRAYNLKHRERQREKAAAWYRDNKERHMELTRSWRAANPHKRRDLEQSRRARAGSYFVEHVDRLIVYEAFGGLCGICGDAVDRERFDIDHVVPISRGGEHSYANVQPAHPRCNQSKKNRLRPSVVQAAISSGALT